MAILVPIPIKSRHLHVLVAIPRLVGELAILAQHLLGQPQSKQHDRLDDAVDDQTRHRNANDVRRHQPAAVLLDVQKVVRVEALGRVRQVRQRQVQREHKDQPPHVDPGRERRARHEDLKRREAAVHGVLAEVGEGGELLREPRAAVQAPPVDGGDDEGVHGDGRVVEGVERLQIPRPAVEQRRAGAGVREGVYGCHEEVEGQPPVCQRREIAEGVARCSAPAERGLVRAVVPDLGEVDDERVEALGKIAHQPGVFECRYRRIRRHKSRLERCMSLER